MTTTISTKEDELMLGTMHTYRDLFPEKGAVGEKFVIRILRNLYQRDCLLILSQLSKHYYKYCQKGCGGENSFNIYWQRCIELISPEIQERIRIKNPNPPKNYRVIFPEPSITHLVKLCLKHCNNNDYTKNDSRFSKETLHGVGEALMVTNSIFADCQVTKSPNNEALNLHTLANLTKQQIVDRNFDMSQKMYQNYFIFDFLERNHNDKFDIKRLFQEKYGVNLREYFAFLVVLQGQYDIKDRKSTRLNSSH